MHHQEFEPPTALQDTIKCFWYDRLTPSLTTDGFAVVPDGNAEIIFYFGGTCSISFNGSLQPLPSPFVLGLQNQPVHFYTENPLEIIAIRCFPWTVFDVLGIPADKGSVSITTHSLARLHPVLQEYIDAGSIDKAIAKVEKYFLDANLTGSANSLISKAGTAMDNAKGTLPVSEVATAAHTTIRTLERTFKSSSGHTVKDVSALIRFEQVRNRLLQDPGANLAALAVELGYTDQPHLSREFKRYSGISPAAFARNAKH